MAPGKYAANEVYRLSFVCISSLTATHLEVMQHPASRWVSGAVGAVASATDGWRNEVNWRMARIGFSPNILYLQSVAKCLA